MLPGEVLKRAQAELLSLPGIGLSVMEISHRSPEFMKIIQNAKAGLRGLLKVPDDFDILFLQGGPTLQFSMVPMNFLPKGSVADYIVTGSWSQKAYIEARKLGAINLAFSTEKEGFIRVPLAEEIKFSTDAAYVHYCSNETIDGVQFRRPLKVAGAPVFCDVSSDICSREIDFSAVDLLYAGAQKNLGPSGVTVVMVKRELIQNRCEGLPSMLDYKLIAENDSLLNTPNTWGIYIVGLMCNWMEEQGGIPEIEKRNRVKAELMYEAIDSSNGFYLGRAETSARSSMNVTFNLRDGNLESDFLSAASERGFVGLSGHRSVGGVRASIYNAFPLEGIKRLTGFMDEFKRQHQ
jgi:phosphoserine aminotransferase